MTETEKEKLSALIQLCGELLQFAWHGDYTNGNDDFGVDEGRVRSQECLGDFEKRFNELKN